MNTTRPIILAGVDGSASSLAAAAYAADLAVRRKAVLRLIYAYETPAYGYLPIALLDRSAYDDLTAKADVDRLLAETAERVRAGYPDLVGIETASSLGGAAAVLVDASRSAAVTVVGCRGVGGFGSLLLGSVSAQVSSHGHGPVIVVRPPVPVTSDETLHRPPTGPVMVGVDGSSASVAAVRFAVEEAAQRHMPLIAVCAYRDEGNGALDTAQAHAALAESVLPYTSQHPDLDVELRARQVDNIAGGMIEVTRGAALIAVGSRGSGGFAELLLGSVSRALVHHAYAPVVVIHASEG